MKKLGAVSILITIVLGLSAFAGNIIFENTLGVTANKTKLEIMYDLVKETNRDVKKLLERK